MSKKWKVALGGVNGRMGRASAKLIAESADFELVGAIAKPGASYADTDLGLLHGQKASGVMISKDFDALLKSCQPDIVLDSSHHDSSVEISKKALAAGIRPVVGTSGIPDAAVKALTELASKHKTGALIIPNFSIGAVLMMEFARQAGAYFENVEIVEMHHTKKIDAPSGTSMHTIKKLATSRDEYNKKEIDEHEIITGSRGGLGQSGVRVHSLRLPGLISHQEVIFGAPGELLTVRHDSFNMECFLKGILMSLQYVSTIDHLELGLDKVLGLGPKEKECATSAK